MHAAKKYQTPTSVLTRATRRNIPEDAILHSQHRENLTSYNLTTVYGRFTGIYCIHLQGREQTSVKQKKKILLGLLLAYEYEASMFLRSINKVLPDCTASHSRRQYVPLLSQIESFPKFLMTSSTILI
jgi:hypothetical protein